MSQAPRRSKRKAAQSAVERYGWWVILLLAFAVIALLGPRVIAHAASGPALHAAVD